MVVSFEKRKDIATIARVKNIAVGLESNLMEGMVTITRRSVVHI